MRFFRKKQRDADLEDEISFDLEAEAEEQISRGMPPEEARQASRRDFGNVALLKEDVRETWGRVWLERLLQDIRYAARTLRRSPVFTAMAVLSLALGIGANTAIYSVLDAILFRALPVRNPEELTLLNWRAIKPPASGFTQPSGVRVIDGGVYEGLNGERISADFPWPFYRYLQSRRDVFSSVLAYKDAGELNVQIQGRAELDRVQFVSGTFFNTLGVSAAAGRLIYDSDDEVNAAPVAVLSYEYWRERFGGNEGVVGQTLRIGDVLFTVAGIAAPEFFGISPAGAPALYVPIVQRPALSRTLDKNDQVSMFSDARYYWADMMARRRPGVTMEQAQRETAARFREFALAEGANNSRGDLPVLWLDEGGSGLDSLRRSYSKPLFVLMTMVAFILAIACANIANLLLARAAARQREMAVRLSLGAGRLRVIRQLLTESVMLSLTGGIAGLAVAAVGIRFLLFLLSGGNSNIHLNTTLDLRILSFTVAIAVVTGILFGLAPALKATGVDIAPTLKSARINAARGSGRFSLSRILVVTQIALSLLLVLGAALFVRSLVGLHSVQLGFNADRVLTFNINASKAGYEGAALRAFYARIEERLRAVPGIEAITVANAPLAEPSFRTPFVLPGKRKGYGGWVSVGPNFFHTMQIPVLLGRGIDTHDTDGIPFSVVVNETFAKKYFPDRSPVGQHIGILDGDDVTIVGVSADVPDSLKQPIRPFAYLSYRQNLGLAAWRGMFFAVRTTGDPLAMAATIRNAVHEVAPAVPAGEMITQSQRIDNSLAQERTFASLCTAFAALALLIASVGLYGSMAYAVSQRTNEIGIRMALGAQRTGIIWLVLREVLVLAVAGLATGGLAAWNAAHAVRSFLFGVRPSDPGTIALAAGILMAALVIAAYAPARRASRLDPFAALRHE